MLLIVQDPHALEHCVRQKAICIQALLMDPAIPPMPHQIPGHGFFDLVTKCDGRQIRAIIEGLCMNPPDNGGYVNAYEGRAVKCPLPTLLQPDTKNHIPKLQAIFECLFLDRPDREGYVDAYKGPAEGKCLIPNLLQPIAKNRSRQPRAKTAPSLITLTEGGINISQSEVHQ